MPVAPPVAAPHHAPAFPPHPAPPWPAAPGHGLPFYAFAAPHDPSRTRLWFSGRRGEFFWLLVRGALLSLVTFGFYRFWLITDVRRHLWANTRIGNEGLEYIGTAKELLIGFLIALAILGPVYAGYFIVTTLAESYKVFAGLALTPLLYVFGQYAGYRARRYRATRTLFRGVRFGMVGSAWAYTGRAALWDLATLLSLGLAYPWRVAALERYKMRHTRFGDLAGDFVATGGALFRRGWWMWAAVIGAPLLLALAAVASGAGVGAWYAGLPLALFLLLVLAPILYPLYLAVRIRWQVEGVRFGPVTVANNLPKGEVFLAYLKLVAASAGLSMLFGLVGIAGAALLAGLTGLDLDDDTWLDALGESRTTFVAGFALTALAYLLFLQGVGVLRRYFIDRGLWMLVASTSSVDHMDVVDRARGAAAPASSVGEGLAEALDVGAF